MRHENTCQHTTVTDSATHRQQTQASELWSPVSMAHGTHSQHWLGNSALEINFTLHTVILILHRDKWNIS